MDTRSINVLSICSGYGGIELGLESVIPARTVCYMENEIGVASIIAARMEDGSRDPAPIWTDLRTFDPEPWRGKVDILAGGVPCQPHSVAGRGLGEDDPRELSGEVLRIADGLGLPVLFLENVPGILRFYWDSIRPKLRELGYQVAEGLFTASETGAPHKRERLFILADTAEQGLQGGEPSSLGGSPTAQSRRGNQPTTKPMYSYPQELADTGITGLQGLRSTWQEEHQERSRDVPLYPPCPNDHEGWAYMLSVMPEVEPTFCRDAHGATTGVERRLRAVGNGVVPAVAALAWQSLSRAL